MKVSKILVRKISLSRFSTNFTAQGFVELFFHFETIERAEHRQHNRFNLGNEWMVYSTNFRIKISLIEKDPNYLCSLFSDREYYTRKISDLLQKIAKLFIKFCKKFVKLTKNCLQSQSTGHSVEKRKILSYQRKISSNQLFRNLLSKTVVFTKFLSKIREREFP